jgi:outer membrane protein OmpA-like peptidoglycan-associated protein
MNRLAIFAMIIALFSGSVGCGLSRTAKGSGTRAMIGSAIGGKVGAVITGGGANGSSIGSYMDKQTEEMAADLKGAKIERVGEGIKIAFDSDILFDLDKSTMRPAAKTNLDKLAVILNKYPDTNILVEGHTDATGSDELNMEVSTDRAASVANHLASLGIDPSRFTVKGYGQSQPVATNDTDNGRKQNRRVELHITANDKLRKVAKQKSANSYLCRIS